MAMSGPGKKASAAQKAQYAPRPKPRALLPQPKVHVVHLISDEVVKKIVQRVLEELKLPGKIPSDVIFAALAEVRDAVERAAVAAPSAKTAHAPKPGVRR